jgi:hypothetical protein
MILGDGGANKNIPRNGFYINADGVYTVQPFSLPCGKKKGLRRALTERGLSRDNSGKALFLECHFCKGHVPRHDPSRNGNEKCCCKYVMSQQPDFLAQKPLLEEAVLLRSDCKIIFYPNKYHCELNYIEMVWGWIKSYHHRTCTYKYSDLKGEMGLAHTIDIL